MRAIDIIWKNWSEKAKYYLAEAVEGSLFLDLELVEPEKTDRFCRIEALDSTFLS